MTTVMSEYVSQYYSSGCKCSLEFNHSLKFFLVTNLTN